MEKKHFYYKLIAPRSTFHLDMSEQEQAAMQQHMQYWASLTQQGKVIVYGPVFDPEGVFGMAVLEFDSEKEANDIADSDPAVSSGVCTYTVIPMQVGILRTTN